MWFLSSIITFALSFLSFVPSVFADDIITNTTDSIMDAFSTGFWSTLGAAVIVAFQWLLNGFILVIGYVIHCIFSGVLTVVSTSFIGLGIATNVASMVANLVGLPDGCIWFLNQVGFFPGLTAILASIIVRKGLDVIPLPWQL